MLSKQERFLRSVEFSRLPDDMKSYLAPEITTAFQAVGEIQQMHSHPLYRTGEWIYDRTGLFPRLGEILYETGKASKKFWRTATFRD